MNNPLSSDEILPSDLRAAAISVVRRLVDAGYEAYFAGGCVRDRLMGHTPDDYDVATNATPQEVGSVFPHAPSVGESFGVMLVRSSGHTIQVATFRTDGVYADGRHPDHVTFSDARHDATRRDFTINGMFEDPLSDRIIDYVDGQADLHNRLIRAIGDAHARLREDRLRMLRAVRFAARFGFAIETETADAIRQSADDLHGVSRERIGEEVRKMLSHSNRAVAAWEIQYLGLDAVVLQEPHLIVAPTKLGRLDEKTPYPTALAAWLLDRFEAAPTDLSEVVRRWTASLMLSNAEAADLRQALDTYRALLGPWFHVGVARQKRLAATPAFEQALALLQATDRQAFIDVRRRVLDLSTTGLAPAPFIDGSHLIALGLQPGPKFKWLLDSVYDAQLEGSILDQAAALQLARTLAVQSPSED